MGNLAAHHHDLQPAFVAFLDYRMRNAQPGDKGRRAFADNNVDGGIDGFGLRRQQIHAERLFGQRPHGAHLGADFFGCRRRHAECAIAARL